MRANCMKHEALVLLEIGYRETKSIAILQDTSVYTLHWKMKTDNKGDKNHAHMKMHVM